MEFLSSLFYFIIVVGILVVIHEFGHFIAARLSGIRVDIFSVGMGHRLFGFSKKDGFKFGKLPEDWTSEGFTDYRLSLFPIGGYVKVAGMVDESMDVEFANKEPQPWEFRSKGTIKKIFVMSFGVIMNALLTILIFSGIAYFSGTSLWNTTEVGYVGDKSLAKQIGFHENDKILSINGKQVNTWDQVLEGLTLDDFGKERTIKVLRNGSEQTLTADGGSIVKAVAGEEFLALYPKDVNVRFRGVETLRPAGKAGLQRDDKVVSLNGEPINSTVEFVSIIKSNKSKPIAITVNRNGKEISTTVVPDEGGKIGVEIENYFNGKKTHKDYNIAEAASIGVQETIGAVKLFIGSIVQIFEGNISFRQSMGGPIMIAKKASEQAEMGIVSFLHFMALLSITLAIINILPFPALDGGHIVFVLIEGLIRKEIPIKIKMAVQQFGIVVLLLLMAFIFYNDLTR